MQYNCSTYIQAADSYTVAPGPTSSEGEHDYCTPLALWYPVECITDVKLCPFCLRCSLYRTPFWLSADLLISAVLSVTGGYNSSTDNGQQISRATHYHYSFYYI